MAVRTQPTLLPGISARVTEEMALSSSSFRKWCRFSYETPSSSGSPASSLTLLIRKTYRGNSEPILDTETESEESKDEGPGSESEEATPEGQQSVPNRQRVDETPTLRLPTRPTWTPTSPEWSSGSLLVSPASLIVPSPVASLVTTPASTIAVDEYKFIKARYKDQREIQALRMQHAVDQHEMQGLRERVATFERKMDCFERWDRLA
nr:hypothetical protein [Tanacetum cinerariifolium]